MNRRIYMILNSVRLSLGMLAMVCLSVSSCKHEQILLNLPNENLRTVGGYITNNYDYSLFNAALAYTGLLDTITYGEGPYTVLAPGNAAFEALDIKSAADIRKLDRDSLRRIMAYHILPLNLKEEDIPLSVKDVAYPTLAGIDVKAYRVNWESSAGSSAMSDYQLVNFSGSEIKKKGGQYDYMNSANYSNTVLSNGILHTIVKIMKPLPDATVQDYLASQTQYSIFVAGLKQFGLWDELKEAGPFTIFAPTNVTFQSFDISLDSVAHMDPEKIDGDLLFGSYILYGYSFLISDHCYYYAVSGQPHYEDKVRGATAYHRFFLGNASYSTSSRSANIVSFSMGSSADPFSKMAYSVGITKEDKPWGYGRSQTNSSRPYEQDKLVFLGDNKNTDNSYNALMRLPMGMNMHGNDNICGNGTVHQFHALTVLPEEAIKE